MPEGDAEVYIVYRRFVTHAVVTGSWREGRS